jgi:hypothetical protein
MPMEFTSEKTCQAVSSCPAAQQRRETYSRNQEAPVILADASQDDPTSVHAPCNKQCSGRNETNGNSGDQRPIGLGTDGRRRIRHGVARQ